MKTAAISRYILRTLTFLLIGGFMIVMTDILILGDKGFLWQKNTTPLSGDPDIDVVSLRAQHNDYMQRGIITEQDDRAPPFPLVFQTAKTIQDSSEKNTEHVSISVPIENNNYALLDPPGLDATWDRIEEKRLNDIEPAIGTEGTDLYAENTKSIEDEHVHLGYKDINTNAEIQPLSAESSIDEIVKPKEQTSYTAPQARGKIAIIIDDMGLGLRSKQVEILRGPLTLSYLPYAKNLPERIQRAKAHGHEIMLHIPMEPMNGSLDGGPHVLTTSMSRRDFDNTLTWGLSQFDGYVGVNNHMGSRLTADKKAMRSVMEKLKTENVFFIDSKTIASSVAADTAREFGIPYAERDVFLDHDISMDFIQKALAKTEHIARDKGYAIAIGHPHAQTIRALKEWTATLDHKGLQLVPASELVHRPSPDHTLASAP